MYSEDLKKRFGASSAFRINDTTAFGVAISYAILGFMGGIEGSCIYQKGRGIHRHIPGLDANVHDPPKQRTIDDLWGFTRAIANHDNLFLKDERFAIQQEYRFLWSVRSEVNGTLDVVCPEAIQYCEKITDAPNPNPDI